MTDRKHIIDCDCHHQLHFLQIDYMEWEHRFTSKGKLGQPSTVSAPVFGADINLFFCSSRIGGFWRRMARAARYVFGTQELVTGDICVSPESAREAARFLAEVADAAEKHIATPVPPPPPMPPKR